MASGLLRFVHFPRPCRLPRLPYRLLSPATRINPVVITLAFNPNAPTGPSFTSSSSSFSEANDYSADDYSEDDIRNGILDAALEFVPTHGWSREAIVEAAEKYGYPGVAHGMFPGGGADLATHFYAKSNAEFRQWLISESADGVPKVGVFVREAVERRIKMTIPYKDTWPQAMAQLSSSSGVKDALGNLSELVDDIWFYAGDKSVDSNWYTKRMLLASIYKTTELFMLQDESEGHKETWAFLDRRMEDVAWLGKTINQQKESVAACAESMTGIASTLANVSGLAYK